MQPKKLITQLGCLVLLVTFEGCATTAKDPQDPWEGWNRGAQIFNDKFDDYAMKPIAEGYQWITPSFVDTGVSNFFSNINDIGVTINDLLQFKIEQTGMDGSRFLVNTIAGVAGFIDVATTMDLPKHNEDFDQTMGVWGIPTGPYSGSAVSRAKFSSRCGGADRRWGNESDYLFYWYWCCRGAVCV